MSTSTAPQQTSLAGVKNPGLHTLSEMNGFENSHCMGRDLPAYL
jgi:hypothetical protein